MEIIRFNGRELKPSTINIAKNYIPKIIYFYNRKSAINFDNSTLLQKNAGFKRTVKQIDR